MILLEVMDKEPTVLGMWCGAVLWGGLGFVLSKRWWWAAVPFLAFAALGTAAVVSEIHDPFVGPAILQEAGPNYPVHAYVTAAINIALPLVGAAVGLWQSWRPSAAAA
jgi:hypothetical protein